MAQFQFLILLIFLASQCESAKARLKLMWRTFDCVTNPDYISEHKCIIIEPEKSLISTELQYIKDVTKFNATFKLFMPRKPSRNFQKVIDVNVDICQFAKGIHGHRFMTIVIKAFGKQGSQLKCPHPKGLYVYPNINIAENLPAFLPETDFKIEMNFLTSETHLFNTSLTGFLFDPIKRKPKTT
ncbi:uncharacterized protein LOC6530114 [Drosophila yakuba]|uniref:MD-2-related lipid-recognition domain-containing protein n=1 Tax=Drosophila yakuba TaxID=7245 RepID=B4P5B0_DROYA|nr:uncharacterized protein LOC6530114 [Drosophila yakuba]EDW90772.1 uncharacterized protein Dyak_GE12459 [Drosophila yakuba]